ncbi:hypothetical protein H6F78_23055 [Coleofasciculus sp. FACHB-64]|nr:MULTISPECIES: hypothetical protein [unclassified Coleofasciculus]MBD1839004.1 hypothetical protein [Coleofasciculus sp. FACHB-501]MBD1880397.1 hypothetical protein [Coleofasciculus sp. FACHB-T130]MBD1890836.1 hypothetical protein [Coleofasciculus sp. FACHB-SPT9]MBD1896943.1 hypothetical protein [Coleofasciculus sp. FACHB-129]MBD1901213.1 hypothetical protein [Coleofasciculus sp. FACHB-125]
MTKPTEIEKQQYARIKELFALSRQRYLDAGGDPRKRPSGLKGDDYLTDEERQELFAIARGGVKIIGDEVHCEGRSWKISAKDINN